ncbi:MAG TPA: PstS family phosphate ABC transporter substrate-binding protein [Tepidiformaceae bacterium]|nr:PstS family phosphate ABC transporter substrate-binding protein [Tepidiformaceae bacterium]
MLHKFLKGKRAYLLAATVSLVVFGAAACGDDDDDDDNEDTTPGADTPAATATAAQTGLDYSKLSGEVRVDGSSTVFPISQAVAEDFSKEAKNVRANVALSGTGGGFEKFCRGEIQVSDASRPIKDSEKEACAKNNIPADDIVEIQVAIDALTVVVNPQNTWAKCMTTDQLQLAFKNGGASKWSDIDPSWPNENIKFYYPGADSGTFDYFKEATKLGGEKAKQPAHRSDGVASEDDNVLVQGIEGDKNAIGYFGFAYYEEAGKKLTAVEIDGGKGCVAPSFDAALDGTYAPLSRPLFIYTTKTLLKERDEVLGFVKYYVDHMNDLAKEVGYISLPDDLLKQQQDKVESFLP